MHPWVTCVPTLSWGCCVHHCYQVQIAVYNWVVCWFTGMCPWLLPTSRRFDSHPGKFTTSDTRPLLILHGTQHLALFVHQLSSTVFNIPLLYISLYFERFCLFVYHTGSVQNVGKDVEITAVHGSLLFQAQSDISCGFSQI